MVGTTVACAAAFEERDNIKDLYYSGTAEDRSNISHGENNSDIYAATRHFNYPLGYTGFKDDYFYEDDVRVNAYRIVEFNG